MQIDEFMGTWHIILSTLKMWRTGGRRNPRLVYGRIVGEHRWSDAVHYEQPALMTRGGLVSKQVLGIDSLDPTRGPYAFNWRGAGLLSWVTCKCQVRETGGVRSCC